ncbi:hypothetical protein CJU94_04385 [Paraburkholderia aromaticivorans]|uniref:Uncharacterized protein n=1 Tax=Paraburkholderia aromaticivorans TaxID=2026199 RepID=A0A248VFZ3_9BURK|nr:hypothetical protein CJU94_04385 [Paraburkholderia aromaticivorans]
MLRIATQVSVTSRPRCKRWFSIGDVVCLVHGLLTIQVKTVPAIRHTQALVRYLANALKASGFRAFPQALCRKKTSQ